MTVFLFFKCPIVEFALKSFSKFSIAFLDLLSDALIMWHENPKCSDISFASEVLPMPGGPEIKQALAFVFCTSRQAYLPFDLGGGNSFLLPRMITSSQSDSHCLNWETYTWLPTRSSILLGLYFSTHRLEDESLTMSSLSPTTLFPRVNASSCNLFFKNCSKSLSDKIVVPSYLAFRYFLPSWILRPSSKTEPVIK